MLKHIVTSLAFGLLATTGFAQANRFTAGIKIRIQVVPNEAQKKVDVLMDGKLFTSYLFDPALKKPVLYPIMSPKGNFITRGWPIAPRPGERVDHPHHVGLWFNYGNVNGVDYWNNSSNISPENKGPFGTIRHKSIKRANGGSQVGVLETESEWVDNKGQVVITENTVYRFSGQGSDRQIDRITTLKAGAADVFWIDNKEGLIGLRLARELEHPTAEQLVLTGTDGKAGGPTAIGVNQPSGMYTNSEAQSGDSVWGKRAEWCMLDGKINGEPLTIALLDHPKNLGYPTYWHARGYGLFAANPLGQAIFSNGVEELNAKIPAGKSVQFRYRLYIQSGRPLGAADTERLFSQFGKPDEEDDN